MTSDNPTYKVTFTGFSRFTGYGEKVVVSGVSNVLKLLGQSGDNASELVREAPSILAQSVSKEIADRAQKLIIDSGGQVDVSINY